MLGRTAGSLFWLGRYIERAENVARLLDVGHRVSLTSPDDQWESTLQTAGIAADFAVRGEPATLEHVARYMLFEPDNGSSVFSCLMAARTNARSVRTAITTEMWETLNATWLRYDEIRRRPFKPDELPNLLAWVKRGTAQFRGAFLNTILRREGYCFVQLGTFSERADNTSRILDVKHYVLLPRSGLSASLDQQQWSVILRAASAHRSYRHVYRDRLKAVNVAEFLILRREMPRSLAHCYQWIDRTLGDLETIYDARPASRDLAQETQELLEDSDVGAIFRQGLHDFLMGFVRRNNALGVAIGEDYNFT